MNVVELLEKLTQANLDGHGGLEVEVSVDHGPGEDLTVVAANVYDDEVFLIEAS